MPGAPEGMLDQMKTALEGAYGEGFCLTPEEADKGFEEQLGQVAQNGECNFSNMGVYLSVRWRDRALPSGEVTERGEVHDQQQ